MKSFSTIVLGLGAVGSAATYQLAKRGNRVLGIDQFSPPHTMGSTHGETRITRKAIGEGEQFTPISLRGYEVFRELEAASGASLLTITGGLMISGPTSGGIHNTANFFKNTLAAAEKFDIRHDVLNSTDIGLRFPQFKVRADEIAYYEYDSGVLAPERCVEVQLALAEKRGADIHRNERVLGFSADTTGGVTIQTDIGLYQAEQLIISAGPWLPGLVSPEVAGLFKVQRQVQFWFDVQGCYESFAPGNFPIFIWELSGDCQSMYGFPAMNGPGGGFKIGTEGYNEVVTVDTVERDVSAQEMAITLERQIRPYFPAAIGACINARVCLYTATPDTGFVIDRLPENSNVIVCSPCSGHGFKHSAAIGEGLAQMILDGAPKLDFSAFRLSRFKQETAI